MKDDIFATRAHFTALIHECEVHKKRINQAVEKCKPFFPLSSTEYESLTDTQVEHIDQLVYRFSKLQDALGAKLFPAVVSVLREDSASLTMYDKINELEKAGAISAADEWEVLREIRNQLAHDYQDDPEEGSFYLNQVYGKTSMLLSITEEIVRFVQNKVLPAVPE